MIIRNQWPEERQRKLNEGQSTLFWNGDQVEEPLKNEERDLIFEQYQVTSQTKDAFVCAEARIVSTPQVLEGKHQKELDYETAIE